MGDKKKNRKLGLPTFCPAWCSEGLGGHRRALEEGADVEYAGQHTSADLGGWPRTLVHPSGGKVADTVALNLTTGEARTLASQLVMLADAEDADLS